MQIRFDKATYLQLLLKSILSKKLINSLWESDVLIFSEFINIVSILCYNFFEFIILLHTFLVISFTQYRQYIIWRISLNSFSCVLPSFTCTIVQQLWVIFQASAQELFFFSPLPFCCLLKLRIFSTILIILCRFLFLRISLLLKEFLNATNESLRYFTILPFLIWFSSYESFVKNGGDW